MGHKAFVQKWLADKGQSHAQYPSCPRRAKGMVVPIDVRRPMAHHILRNLPPSEVSQF